MKTRLTQFAVLVASLIPLTGYAQTTKDLVRRAVEDAANGICSNVLSPMVKVACQQQMPNFKERIAALGPILSIEYQGDEITPQGAAEVYLVKHQKKAMAWMAIADNNGKLRVFWTPG